MNTGESLNDTIPTPRMTNEAGKEIEFAQYGQSAEDLLRETALEDMVELSE